MSKKKSHKHTQSEPQAVSQPEVIEDLIEAGVIEAGDMESSGWPDFDNTVTGGWFNILYGGDGDDHYIGRDGVSETF